MFSVSVRQDIPLPKSEEDPKGCLLAVLNSLGYRHYQDEGLYAFASMPGSWYHLNPNRLKHCLEYTHSPGEACVHLQAHSTCLPWTRKRVERLLGGHIDRIEQRLSEHAAPGGKRTERLLLLPPVGGHGFFPSLGSVFLSLLLGTLFACLVHLAFGYGLMQDTLDSLIAKSVLLTGFSPLPLPGHEFLGGLPDSFLWACALFFAIPLGMLTGFGGSLLLLLGEVWCGLSRLAIPLLFLSCLALCAYAYPSAPGLLSVACALFLPCAILTGYTLGWGIRGATPSRSFLPVRRSTFLLLAVLLLIQGWVELNRALPAFAGGRAANFLEFRDRHLLQSSVGAWLTDFYYTYTLYPAEAIKPPMHKTAKAALLYAKGKTLRVQIRDFLASKGVRVISVDEAENFSRLVGKGGFDFLFLDPAAAGVLECLPEAGQNQGERAIQDATALVGAPEDIEALCRRGGSRCRPALVSTPLTPEKLGAALASVAERLDRNQNLRRAIRLSLYFTLAGLWAMSALTKMILVLLPALIALHVGLRRLPGSGLLDRIGVLVPALLASGMIGWMLYANGPESSEITDIRSLGTRTDSVERLCSYMDHPSPDVRYEAVYGLWRLTQKEPGLQVRGPARIRGIEDPDPRVRAWSFLLLGREEGKTVQGALIRALEDPALFVRTKAAAALGRTGDAFALEALERRIDDEEVWYVRQHLLSARRALIISLRTT